MDPVLGPLVERVRDAAARGAALRIRGGGTKDFHGERLEGDILDTRSLRSIVAYEPSELVVTVQAGMPLAELESVLAEKGQCLPFEPPHFAQGSTVGGMVAAGLSGPARASVGSVRDYVLGVNLVNGKGEVLVFGGQVMKNVAGYDVSRLMAGALGTLGLITEVSLKVLGRKAAEATLRFELSQADALVRLNQWGGKPLPLDASCWRDGVLLLRLRGAIAAVDSACAALGGERVDDTEAAREWELIRDQRHAWFQAGTDRDLWRLSVPQTAPVLDTPGSPLVEWHGGQRWIFAARSEGAALRDRAARASGHATLFHASSSASASETSIQRFHPVEPTLARIHRELKRQFDPAGIFNPGRLYGDI